MEIGQAKCELQACDAQFGIGGGEFAEEPTAVGLGMVFDVGAVLVDDEIVSERLDGPVQFKLANYPPSFSASR